MSTNSLREAAQQALEALEFMEAYLATEQQAKSKAITALRAALAEPDEFIEDETIYCPTCGEEDGGTTCRVFDCGLRCGAESQTTHWEGCEAVHPECKAKADEQEPVAWVDPAWLDPETRGWPSESFTAQSVAGWVPVFTAPTPRKPLTDEEIRDLWSWAMTVEAERTATTQQHAFARAIERAHGIGDE